MVRLSLLAGVATVLVAGPAYAQTDQVRRGPVPTWVNQSELLPVPENPTGPLFMRRQDVLVRLDQKGETQFLGYRIKILHPNALQLGNLSIAWNPASGSPVVHSIKVYRGSETIDVLEKSSFEILRREDQLEAARLDGRLTAVLRIPDLRVGDELEVQMTTVAGDPTLGRNAAGLLVLGANPSPGRYHLGLSWDKDRQPNLKITDDLSVIAVTRDNGVDFRLDNPAIQIPPKDAPPRYQWQRAVEYSSFGDWAAVSRHFAPLFASAAKLAASSPIKKEAARIAAEHAGPLDRASAALKLVQQDVRYIYVGLNGGNLTPASADETWQRRYGDCKGKTVLLLALLSELGIKADAVLVNASGRDDGLNERLPSPQMFDHVLVRAQIDGAAYWLDGTLPPVVPPSAEPFLPFKWVLPLTAQGHSLERLEWKPATRPEEIHLYEIDARAGFDKPAHIISTAIIRGLKGLQEQAQFSATTHEEMLAGFRQQLTGDIWQAIEDVQWRYDQKAGASILTVSGTGTVDWDNDGNGARSLALVGGGFNPPDKRVRAVDRNQNVPFYITPEFNCYVTTVRLPTSAPVQHWSSKTSYDMRYFGSHYYRGFELRDGAIRMVRGLRVEHDEIDVATAKRDTARVSAFDNSMGWIFYNPAAQKTAVGDGRHVPATYEIDWTANDVPCLASAEGS